jgi:hypothetical protein
VFDDPPMGLLTNSFGYSPSLKTPKQQWGPSSIFRDFVVNAIFLIHAKIYFTKLPFA